MRFRPGSRCNQVIKGCLYSESSDQDVRKSGNQEHLKANFEHHENLLNFYGWRSRIKPLGKVKSSDQGTILAIKLLDPSRKHIDWQYGSDYPFTGMSWDCVSLVMYRALYSFSISMWSWVISLYKIQLPLRNKWSMVLCTDWIQLWIDILL